MGKSFYIVDSGFGSSVYFSKEGFNRNEGYDISYKNNFQRIDMPGKVLTCSPSEVFFIENNFEYELIYDHGEFCKGYSLLKRVKN